MSTPPSSLAWRSVSAQLAWPAARSPSTAAAALGAGLGGEAVVGGDPVGPEGVERPVLQEDVDGLAERGRAGGQDGGGLELVVGPGEEDQVQGFVHRRSPRCDMGMLRGAVSRSGMAPAASSPRRARRRSSTPRIRPQATMTSGSAKR